MEGKMNYKIYPIVAGRSSIAKCKLIYQGNPMDEKYDMTYGCFLLQNEDGEWLMIDTGYPTKEYIISHHCEDMFPIHPGIPESSAAMLAPYGVKPEEIKYIILTHLHYDHSWNLRDYPNAKLYAQTRDMDASLHPLHRYSERVKAFGHDPRTIGDSWLGSADRMNGLDGDVDDVLPGISVKLTRGHSLGSQTIIVDTKEGKYAFPGDYAPNLDIIMENRDELNLMACGMVINLCDWYEDWHKIRDLRDAGVKFLTSHDPRCFTREVIG